MAKIIITTVGTSLIEKLGVKPHRDLKKGTHSKDWVNLSDDISELRATMSEKFGEKQNENTFCAEIQSISKIQETYPDIAVYLICTDTILSPLCAEFIKQKLGDNVVETKIITGLVVDGKDASKSFEDIGFPNLIDKIKEIERKGNDENRPILNISGGYKALIPVMTIMGQLYDMECNYMYEDSEELIKISKLPINFDWTLVSYFGMYLTSRVHQKRNLNQNEIEMLDELSEIDIFKLDKQTSIYKRTIIGDLFAQYIEEEHPTADNAMGFIMEYRVFEFLIKYKKSTYKEVLHSEKLFGRELDLVLMHSNSDDRSIGEVKSYNQVQNTFSERSKDKDGNIKNLSTQIKAQFDEFKINNFMPREYHIYVHKQFYFSTQQLVSNLQLLKKEVNQWSNNQTVFKAFYFKL